MLKFGNFQTSLAIESNWTMRILNSRSKRSSDVDKAVPALREWFRSLMPPTVQVPPNGR